MLEKFEEIAFQKKTLKLIDQANVIIAEMAEQGYTLTVRQLYYQFVSRDFIENTQANYKRLAGVIDNGRKAGLIDWDAIEDRTRHLRAINGYDGPRQFLRSMVRSYYAEKLWQDQDVYCEVWVEKDALLGVIERPCLELRVPYFACRGYASSSELYTAGKRLRDKLAQRKRVVIFHLGDHDPSGLNMTDVNRDSLHLFGRNNRVEVNRLALNMNQVEEYDPPPNFAKDTDARFAGYQQMMDDEGYEDRRDDCWELDALNPSVIDTLIRDNIAEVLDQDKFDAAKAAEATNQATIQEIADNFDDAARYMKYRWNTVEPTDAIVDAEDVLKQAEAEAANGDDEEEEPED